MPIDVSKIALGKCYVTDFDQVRHVLKHENGRVQYESRGKKAGAFTNRVWCNETTFADAVDREVNCDWDPRFGGPSL